MTALNFRDSRASRHGNVSAAVAPALADDKIVKIGVITDLSSLYADDTGLGSVLATEMAVEDSGLTAEGWKIDVISGDHRKSATGAPGPPSSR